MASDEDPKYPVGYGKPPRHGQFKPGVSGNTRGRPKGAKNFATVIEEELRAPIEVTENGKRKRISKKQAIVKQTVNRAAAGDPKATSILLAEDRLRASQNQLPIAQSLVVSPEDQMVMNTIVQRIWLSQPPGVDRGCAPEAGTASAPPPHLKEGEL